MHVEKPLVALPPVILIAEDETILQMNAIDLIELVGFQVIEAPAYDGALNFIDYSRQGKTLPAL